MPMLLLVFLKVFVNVLAVCHLTKPMQILVCNFQALFRKIHPNMEKMKQCMKTYLEARQCVYQNTWCLIIELCLFWNYFHVGAKTGNPQPEDLVLGCWCHQCDLVSDGGSVQGLKRS